MRRPDEHLAVRVRTCQETLRAAHDPAVGRRLDDEPPVVRSADQVEGIARVGEVEEDGRRHAIEVPGRQGQRRVDPLAAIDQASVGRGERRSRRRIGRDRGGVRLGDLDEGAARRGECGDRGPELLGQLVLAHPGGPTGRARR